MFTQNVGYKGTHPIIFQAPMAGGVTTPELVASVSNAGGVGSFATGYLTTQAAADGIARIQSLTDKPFAVNLFIPNVPHINQDAILAYQEALNEIRKTLHLPVVNEIPPLVFEDNLDELIEVVIEASVKIVSFTFGNLEASIIKHLKARGVYLVGTANTVSEAKLLEAAGIDAVVVQGRDAGGHQGGFLAHDEPPSKLAELLPRVAKVVSCPLIAAGGIMTYQDIQAISSLGANAVQLGTAFLTTQESGANQLYKKELLKMRGATKDNTVLTTSFTGKLARGLNVAFVQQIEKSIKQMPEYPIAHLLSAPLRKEAALLQTPQYMSLWCGVGVTKIQSEVPAYQLLDSLRTAR